MPLRLLIPNLITLFALGLGLTAIRLAMEGSIDWAVSAVAAAAVLDGLDGRIARALKGTSRFGAELDSLADFVDFGVAPALVLYVANLHAAKNFGWVAALLFAMACALRLARFNVMIDEDQPAWRKDFLRWACRRPRARSSAFCRSTFITRSISANRPRDPP